ncbi:MAG: hypothetical protein P8184_10215 [Calditrichia bacterium]
MTKEIEDRINEAFEILEEIELLSEKGIPLLEQDDLSGYNEILQKREEKIAALADLKNHLSDLENAGLSGEEQNLINGKFQKKMENLAKVDKKTFDIMKYKKLVLKEKMGQANQGKSFLKNYKKQVNSQETFYKTI